MSSSTFFRRIAQSSALRRSASQRTGSTRTFHTSRPNAKANTPPPNAPKTSNGLRNLSLAAALGVSTYTLGAISPPTPLTFLFPRSAPGPLDPSTPEAIQYSAELEEKLQTLPNVIQHRLADEGKGEWYETRPYVNYPEERRVNNMTAGALRGPGKLAIAPLVRSRKDETEAAVFIHVGRSLCGHDGIIHGGMLATLLDETLARTAINNLPEKVGMTVSLTLNYRAPTKADQFIVIRTFLTEVKGRKATVSGRVEDLDGRVLAEANAVFVQPKYAGLLDRTALKAAMGEPTPTASPATALSAK